MFGFFKKAPKQFPVVTRFAPSPTGHLHAGGYRTAFFSYLFAKKHHGKFILRIEDTDKDRSKDEYTEEILKVFDKIGIAYDEKYIQSENLPRHQACIREMIEQGSAYISREEAKDGSGQIKEIVRFKNPNKVVVFDDLVRGTISTDTTDLGDFVIARNIEEPLFHLAVVIDDHDEGVTHVIRAEEHIANTPRQILIHEALGFAIPAYAHLPLVLAPDKTKMSKRKGAIPVITYLEQGYLPEALLNAICLCGWNTGTDQEIFSRAELEEIFDLDKVHKAGAVFSDDKLRWFNREWMKMKPDQEIIGGMMPHCAPLRALPQFSEERLSKVIPIIRERMDVYSDIEIMIREGELGFFFEAPTYPLESIVWKNSTLESARTHLAAVLEILTTYEGRWTESDIKEALWPYAGEHGRGDVLWPLRYALSGREKSPDPFAIASVIGKSETLLRIQHALSL